jgi:hypothetical protein
VYTWRRTVGCIAGITVALMLCATQASASSLSLTERLVEIYFREVVLEGAGTQTLRCALNLRATLSSGTFAKVREGVIGGVYGAAGWCNSGDIVALGATLPWRISYVSFTGTLPNISQIALQLDNGGFTANETNGRPCLFEFTRTNGFVFSVEVRSGAISNVVTNERAQVRKESEAPVECRGERIFRGTGELHTSVGATSSVTLSLI